MARQNSTNPLSWAAALIPAVLFAIVWVPDRSVAPMLHTEANALLHSQLGAGALWHESRITGRGELLYWLLASPVSGRADALAILRWASLVAGLVVVLAAARTAAAMWGAGGALLCGGFLVVQPLLVELSLSAGPQIPALAALALAGWQLTSRLENYEELGAGTAIVHAILLVLAVGLDLAVVPALVAHVIYAATMRPSARGWRQLVACWLSASAAAAWVWWGGGPEGGSQDVATVWAAVHEALAGPSSLFWLGPASAVLVLLVSALSSAADSLLDTGLGMSLGMLVLVPLAWVLAGSQWHGAMDTSAMTPLVLGMGLFVGCAAGQWRGQTRQRLVVVVLTLALGLAGWLGRQSVAPSWHNADGNPPLARDLVLRATPGELIVVDDASAPGLSAALADRMGDRRLWQQARDALPDAHLVVFTPDTLDPWSTRPAGLDDARGRLVWVGTQNSSVTLAPRCSPGDTEHYGKMTAREFDCGS